MVACFCMRSDDCSPRMRDDSTEMTHILQIGLRVALLGMNEDWKLGGIPQEEDGSIVKDPVPIALFRVELNREASRITC